MCAVSAEVRLVCIGNPLLDMSVYVDTPELLDKYQLKYDDVREAEPFHKALFDEVSSRSDVSFSPGGGAQNTARIFSWCVSGDSGGVPAAFIGGVGRDSCGEQLEKLVRQDRVLTRYMYNQDQPTGRSVNIIYGANRSLVADIGAATCCRSLQLFSQHDNASLMRRAAFVYVEGFLLTHDSDTAVKVAHFCRQCSHRPASPPDSGPAGVRFVLSLSGVYVCRQHHLQLAALLPLTDFLFCHVTEFRTLAEALGLSSEIGLTCDGRRQLLTRAAQLSSQQHHNTNGVTSDGVNHKLCVVITQSAEPVLVITDTQCYTVAVPPLDNGRLIDTTAAGDAFIAGFLSAILHNLSLSQCASYGVAVSRQIIQQAGCTLPPHSPPPLSPATDNQL